MIDNPLNIGTFRYARIDGGMYYAKEDMPSGCERSYRTGAKYAKLTEIQKGVFMQRVDELMRKGHQNYKIVNICEQEGLTTDDDGIPLSRSRVATIVWKHRKETGLEKPRRRAKNSVKQQTIKEELQDDT